ncbi:MAG: hypothetical protein ACP5J4_20430 [Anaerolineae bacterium]
MQMPVQKTRVVAGTPIEVGERRLLPSVLVTTMEGGDAGSGGFFRFVKARPVSVVVEEPEGARWLEIPNTTENILSQMAAAGAGIAVASVLLMALLHLVRKR